MWIFICRPTLAVLYVKWIIGCSPIPLTKNNWQKPLLPDLAARERYGHAGRICLIFRGTFSEQGYPVRMRHNQEVAHAAADGAASVLMWCVTTCCWIDPVSTTSPDAAYEPQSSSGAQVMSLGIPHSLQCCCLDSQQISLGVVTLTQVQSSVLLAIRHKKHGTLNSGHHILFFFVIFFFFFNMTPRVVVFAHSSKMKNAISF